MAKKKTATEKAEEKVEENQLASTASTNQISTGKENEMSIDESELDFITAASNDNFDWRADIKMSRVAILQPGSPEITNDVSGYSKGDLVDNVTRSIISQRLRAPWLKGRMADEDYEQQSANFSEEACMLYVPVFRLPTEYIKWVKREDRVEGDPPFEFKTLDKNDPRVKEGVWPALGGTWGRKPEQKGVAPPVTDNTNYLVLPIDFETGIPKDFIVLTFSRTSANAGKMLNKFYAGHHMKGLRPWGQLYWCWTKRESDGQQTWWEMRTEPGPLMKNGYSHVEPMVYEMARKLADRDSGREYQETLLSVAEIAEDRYGDSGDGSVNSGNMDASDFASEDSDF